MKEKKLKLNGLTKEKWSSGYVWVYRDNGRILSWGKSKRNDSRKDVATKLNVALRGSQKLKDKPQVTPRTNVTELMYKHRPSLTRRKPYVYASEFEIFYKGKKMGNYYGSATKHTAGSTKETTLSRQAKKNAMLQAVYDKQFYDDYKTSRIPQGFTAKEVVKSRNWTIYVDIKDTRLYT